MRGNDHKDFDESDVEVGPAGDLDLIKTIEEQHSPADVKDNDGIGGKGWKRKKCTKYTIKLYVFLSTLYMYNHVDQDLRGHCCYTH